MNRHGQMGGLPSQNLEPNQMMTNFGQSSQNLACHSLAHLSSQTHPKIVCSPSISKSLPNQHDIHLFLAKQEKLCSNSFASNLANFSNLANLALHAHICALNASAHRSRILLHVHI
jgi:hypothetical protein